MIFPNKFRVIFKSISACMAGIFLWQQVAWAGGGELFDKLSTATSPSGTMTADSLSSSQAAAASIVDTRNAIEASSIQTLALPAYPPGTTYTYYSSGLLESATLPTVDSSGNIYYHYINENWNSQGYGRTDKSKRQTASGGELSHTYIYQADSYGRLKQKNGYAASDWTTLVSISTYYNDANNRMDSKTLQTPDSSGNIYYHYINENWKSQGYGRIDKSRRQTALNGELSHTYIYQIDFYKRLKQKNAYSTASWTTLVATYTYYNNITNRLYSKTLITPDSQGNIYYYYLNENWNNQGYGRVSKSKRKTALNGELSHTYIYQTDSYGLLKQKNAYSTSLWTTSVATYTYYNNPTNRMDSKTLVTADAQGSIYYHYLDENWNLQGYGRVDKSKRQTAYNGELSYVYSYYADSTGRLQIKKSYSDSSWATLVATYTYNNDSTNRIQ
ncbi:MAG: hypothetical protein Q8R48_03590, partial [Candidatus Omnitrophota bacterium]|nr:hypothetical protein [Candidatus Omnitrophota bacterium]